MAPQVVVHPRTLQLTGTPPQELMELQQEALQALREQFGLQQEVRQLQAGNRVPAREAQLPPKDKLAVRRELEQLEKDIEARAQMVTDYQTRMQTFFESQGLHLQEVVLEPANFTTESFEDLVGEVYGFHRDFHRAKSQLLKFSYGIDLAWGLAEINHVLNGQPRLIDGISKQAQMQLSSFGFQI